jgi:hypothetical protein
LPYEGLPDLAAQVNAGTGIVCEPYTTGSIYTVWPNSLTLGTRADGVPDIGLEIHRPSTPGGSDGFAVIAIGLVAEFAFADALRVARQLSPAATVVPATWSAGLVRLDILGGLDGVPTRVQPFLPSGPGGGRIVLSLPFDSAEKLAGALIAVMAGSPSSVQLGGQAVIGVTGVSPRVPVVARFDPAQLLSELWTLGVGGVVRRRDVENLMMTGAATAPGQGTTADAPSPPITLDRLVGADLAAAYAATMTDRIQAQFATLAEGTDQLASGAWWQLADLASVGHGETIWDLSAPVLVDRPLLVNIDATAVASRLLGQDPTTVVHRTVAPSLDFGVVELQVAGRLPRPWIGALSIGVTIELPPDPPFRFQGVSKSVDLDPGSDTVDVAMDFGDGDRTVTSTTYAVIEDQQGAHRIEGPARSQQGTWIDVHGADLPVDLAFLSATPSMLALGQVIIDVNRPPWNPVSISLTAAQPAMAIVAPRGGDPAPQYTVRLRSVDGTLSLDVASGDLAARQFDASSVAEFGHHQVAVTATFADATGAVAVDLVPETSIGDASAITTLRLTASNASSSWTYFAPSPFHAGYCWRLNTGSTPPGPWSLPMPAGSPLTIDTRAAVPSGA